MSLFLPLKRASLLIPSGPQSDLARKHLFVLLTDPHDDGDGVKRVLMASLSSVKPGVPHDPTCLIHPGDHPFVRQISFVLYQKARLEEAEKVLNGVKAGLFIPQDPIDGAIFARICKGLEDSRRTPPKYLEFYLKSIGQ